MTLAKILKEKKENKTKLLKQNNLGNTKLPLGLIKLNWELIDQVLVDALKILPANFIISTEKEFEENKNIWYANIENLNSWYDFIVCDDCEENIQDLLKKWLVPIIFSKHHISPILKEFNAQKIEWNAFIFDNNQLCDIYYAIIRYLENYKFPYDNKALVKNILSI